MAKRFQFTYDTLDQKILKSPVTGWFDCSLVDPQGCFVVREYDGNECIVAMRVFLIYYQGHVYGSKQFFSLDDFINYVNANCVEVLQCKVNFQGCQLVFNDCPIIIPCSQCS